ncbi:MAG: carboxymuconolactone decarboxylase family protein [Motiliproteus sp.]
MSEVPLPKTFTRMQQQHPKLAEAIDALGQAVKQEGPIDSKTAQLIQLAAAASIRSEGAVHSHAKQAQNAGASREEIHHAVILLTSTIGFPSVMAALSWVDASLDPS